MRKAANVAVNNYARLETDCKKQWNFHNSFFFAGTLATTIGSFSKLDFQQHSYLEIRISLDLRTTECELVRDINREF